MTMLVKLRTADGRLVNIPRYVGRREQASYSLWPTGHDRLFRAHCRLQDYRRFPSPPSRRAARRAIRCAFSITAVKTGGAAGHQVCVSITAVKTGTATGHQACVSITAIKTPATANWSRLLS